MLVKKIQKVDIKVHRQFSYPHSDTLLTLLKDGNVISSELEQCIKKLDNEWKVCVEYKKTKPRPIIGLPIAERFNETWKEWILDVLKYWIALFGHPKRFLVHNWEELYQVMSV